MVPLIETRNFLFALIFLPLISSLTLSQEDVRRLCREARLQEDADKDGETIVDGLTKVVESKLSTKAANNQTAEMDKLLVKSLVNNFLTRGFSGYGYGVGSFNRKIKINQKISNDKDAVSGVTNLITLQNPTLKANDLIDRVASRDTAKNSQIFKKFLNFNLQTQSKREAGLEPLRNEIVRATQKTKSSSESVEKCANIRLTQEMDSTKAHKWWAIVDLISEQLQE